MSARGGFVVADLVRKASSLLYCPIQFVPVPVLFIIPGARFREPGPDSSISSGEKKSDEYMCIYIYIYVEKNGWWRAAKVGSEL